MLSKTLGKTKHEKTIFFHLDAYYRKIYLKGTGVYRPLKSLFKIDTTKPHA